MSWFFTRMRASRESEKERERRRDRGKRKRKKKKKKKRQSKEKVLRQAEILETIARRDHGRRFERTAARLSGIFGESAVGDVWRDELLGGMDVFHECDGTKSCWRHERGQILADVCDAKSIGLRWLKSPPSIAVRECADRVCAEDARRCWFVLLVEGGRVVARMAERNCGGGS